MLYIYLSRYNYVSILTSTHSIASLTIVAYYNSCHKFFRSSVVKGLKWASKRFLSCTLNFFPSPFESTDWYYSDINVSTRKNHTYIRSFGYIRLYVVCIRNYEHQ